jgi:hypothetical protein
MSRVARVAGFIFIIIAPWIVLFILYFVCADELTACHANHRAKHESNTEQAKSYVSAPLAGVTDEKRSEDETAEAKTGNPTDQSCLTICDLIARTGEDPVAFFTLVLCYMVFLQVVWMARQEWVLKESLGATRTTVLSFMIAERARIFVEVMHTSLERYARHGEVPEVQLRAVNHGKTAATLIRITALCTAGDKEPTEIRQAEDRLIREGVAIPPGDDWKFTALTLLDEFREDDELNVNVAWYCIGTFEYKDIFGELRTTGFCFKSPGPGSGFVFSDRNPLNYQT